MPIVESFSKRQKAKEGEQGDVYRYDTLPTAFREQVLHIWRGALGVYHRPKMHDVDPRMSPANEYWEHIENTLAREVGLPHLGKSPYLDSAERCVEHLRTAPVEQVLDLIELSFGVIDRRPKDRALRRRHGADMASPR